MFVINSTRGDDSMLLIYNWCCKCAAKTLARSYDFICSRYHFLRVFDFVLILYHIHSFNYLFGGEGRSLCEIQYITKRLFLQCIYVSHSYLKAWSDGVKHSTFGCGCDWTFGSWLLLLRLSMRACTCYRCICMCLCLCYCVREKNRFVVFPVCTSSLPFISMSVFFLWW